MTDITTPPEGYTEDEWEGLSNAEKEGIVESIENPNDEPTDLGEDDLKKIVEEPPKEEPAAEPPAKKADEPPKEEPAPKDKEEPPPADEPVINAVTDDELLKFRPHVSDDELKYSDVVPPEIQAKLDELKNQYDEGEVSIHDYTAQRETLNRQIYKHNAALEAEARSNLVWKKEQMHFLKNRPEYLPGQQKEAAGKIRANALFGALNETVKNLSSDDATAGLSGMQLLIKADAIVKEAFKITTAQKKSDGKPPAALPDHKTLSNVPAAGSEDAVSDAFAQLDKLQGEAYEAALERLTPEQREAYESRL